MNRIVILGNAGSGKSYLARQLGSGRGLPVVYLDDLFWTPPGQYRTKRPADELMALVDVRRQEPYWIVEGVYGELIQPFLDEAECVVWLDMPWEVIRSRLELCQLNENEASDDHEFQTLLTYAEAYWKNNDGRSHAGHLRLFEGFGGEKYHLTSEGAVDSFWVGWAE